MPATVPTVEEAELAGDSVVWLGPGRLGLDVQAAAPATMKATITRCMPMRRSIAANGSCTPGGVYEIGTY